MNKLILNPEYNLFERDGRAFASSRQVAETFGKRHDHVLRDIREAESTVNSFAPQFWGTNFTEHTYADRGKRYPEFLMTKNGFSYIVTGFTGKKAAQFKVAYIQRFDAMESFITSLLSAKLEHPAFTEAVMLAHDEPKHYHFSNESDMINRIALGMSAKQFREGRGVQAGTSIRPFLDEAQIKIILTLQRADIGMLAAGLGFEERKEKLTEYYTKFTGRLSLAG